MEPFDLATHQRRRTRQAEARAAMLERERAKLERLLALALRVAAGDECHPLVLLGVLEEIDRVAKPGPAIDELVVVLRETDPDPSWRTP